MGFFYFIALFITNASFAIAFQYPNVWRNDSEKETRFNIEVKDPYRWLEEPNSEGRKQFITNQNSVSRKYLDSNPYRKQIKQALTDLSNYPKYGIPSKHGTRYYYSYNSGLQNQAIIYSVKDLEDKNPEVFLDPNKLSSDGTTYLYFTKFSPNNKWCVYGYNEGGGDWMKFRIKNVATGEELNETLSKIKFIPPTWTHDSNGFFYSYYDEYKGPADSTDNGSPKNQKIFYHTLNTDQSKDILIAKFPEYPLALLESEVSHDGKYLYVYPLMGTDNNLWYFAKLDGKPIKSALNLTAIITKPDSTYGYITNDDNIIYAMTNRNAPKNRVVAIDINNLSEQNWKTIIPEHSVDTLESAIATNNDYLIVGYLRDVKSVLELRQLSDGKHIADIKIPAGTVQGLFGQREDNVVFFEVTSFLIPSVVYSYNSKTQENKVFKKSQVPGLDPDQFTTDQVFYDSADGKVKVPMFIVHHKNLTRNGNNPTLLYAYGGFAISMLPNYNAFNAFFINNLDGVYAVANIRGGGEYGDSWHKAGMLLNKQNVFDDFHSAAEYLIKNKYTNRNKLTIRGGSNGGLLVGATSNQRPDLYGCSIGQVGVMDMLRYHKFTVGYAWIPEYGNPDEEIHLKNLIKYSPVHNVPSNATQYPAILLTTADHDDRVVPSHSFKFVSQLQFSLGHKLPDTPIMIRIDSNAGHGTGKSTAKIIEEYTDIISFIMNSLNIHINSDL